MIRLVAIATTCAAAATAPAAGNLNADLGAYEFQTYCAACHGTDGKGQGPVSAYITVPPADLTVIARENGGVFPERLIEELIDGRVEVKVHGPRDMPVWGDWFDIEARAPEMSPEDRALEVKARIQNLTSYVKTIQEP